MNFIKHCIYPAVCLGVIILFFTITGLFDIVLAVFYSRFYSTAAFIVTFGVGGVFACIFCYTKAVQFAPAKNEFTRWSIIIFTWIISLLFIFLLSALEGGEYEAAFISFGITLALTTLLFVKGKVEL